MAFDPTKPTEGTITDAVQMRGQLNALKALIDAQAGQIAALRQQVVTSALVLTANLQTMALNWTYTGPACDGFHIFVHQPNEPAGTFNDRVQVAGNLRTWATGFDSPADALGYAYYLVPMDGDENPLTPPSNAVGFVATPSPGDLQNQLNAQGAQIATQSGQIAAQQTQITTLTQQIASVPTTDQVNAAITANSAGSVAYADTFGEEISNPPTQAEVQLIVEYLTYLVGVMKRS